MVMHGVWICNSKNMMTSQACRHHGLGPYNARKKNYDDDELRLIFIVVLKAHMKRRKHDDKEELEYVILEARQ
jgi:hypothetical protein